MTLLKFAQLGGQISWDKVKEISKRHSEKMKVSEIDELRADTKDIQGLRTELKRIFGIEDAPIPKYDKRYGYQLLCTINYEEVS
jgi:hypothetical protein